MRSPKKLYAYHSHKSWGNTATQTEDCGLPPLEFLKQNKSNNTPVKIRSLEVSKEAQCAPIGQTSTSGAPVVVNNEKRRSSGVINLPGKKVGNPGNYECRECGVVYNSSEDIVFRDGKLRKSTWIGCDHSRCDYWAHACCANMQFKPRIPVDEHAFLCPKHKQGKRKR